VKVEEERGTEKGEHNKLVIAINVVFSPVKVKLP
jgi:hypothetical protein